MDAINARGKKTKSRFSYGEIALMFGVTARTVARWADNGWLHVERHGKKSMGATMEAIQALNDLFLRQPAKS